MAKVSLEKDKIKILLLEGLHPSSVEVLQASGYTNIEYHKGSMDESELLEAIKDVHFIGIRSRTNLTEKVIDAAEKLVAIGCFCIGTNQVNLNAAAKRGIPVFNAPFSNTRSVAELVLGEILLLLRGIPEKNALAHRGVWKRVRTTLTKHVARNLVSSVTAISVLSWALLLKTSACTFTTMTSRTNCH